MEWAAPDHIHLHLEHLEGDVIEKRLPRDLRDGTDIPRTSMSPRSPSRSFRPCTTTWGGSPTNVHGEVVTSKAEGSEDGGAGTARDWRMRLRIGPRREPVGLELAARHRGVRPGAADRVRRSHHSRRTHRRSRGNPRSARSRASTGSVMREARGRRHPSASKCSGIRQNNAAVFRTGEVLEEGCRLIDECRETMSDVRVSDRSLVWNSTLRRRSSSTTSSGRRW